MTRKTKILLIPAAIAVLLVVGTAAWFSRDDHIQSNGANGPSSLVGALFNRATAVSDLKQRMGHLRDAYTALTQFAQAHHDELPKTVAELRPYLPAKLAFLDDEHWELPSAGKFSPLVTGNDASSAVLLQEKSVVPDHPRIILYGDGHIEYRAQSK